MKIKSARLLNSTTIASGYTGRDPQRGTAMKGLSKSYFISY